MKKENDHGRRRINLNPGRTLCSSGVNIFHRPSSKILQWDCSLIDPIVTYFRYFDSALPISMQAQK